MFRWLKVFLCLSFLLVWSQAQAAVSLDACGAEAQSPNGILTYDYNSMTVGTGTVLVLLIVTANGGAISAVTANWDQGGTPTAMTQLGSATNGSNAQVVIFGLRNPVSGTKVLRISWTTAAEISVVACSWQGADTTSDATAFKNFNSSSGSTTSAQSVTITSTANDAVMAGHNGVTTSYGSVNQTQIFVDNTGLQYATAGNRATGLVNPTMTANFSGTFTTISAGISIAAAGGGGGGGCSGNLLLRRVGGC